MCSEARHWTLDCCSEAAQWTGDDNEYDDRGGGGGGVFIFFQFPGVSELRL